VIFLRIKRPNLTQYPGKLGQKFSTIWMSSPLGLGSDTTQYSEPVTYKMSLGFLHTHFGTFCDILCCYSIALLKRIKLKIAIEAILICVKVQST